MWRVLPSSNSTYFSYPPEFGEILFHKIVQDININGVLYVKAEYLLWFLVLHAIPHSRSFFWSNLLDYWRKKGFLYDDLLYDHEWPETETRMNSFSNSFHFVSIVVYSDVVTGTIWRDGKQTQNIIVCCWLCNDICRRKKLCPCFWYLHICNHGIDFVK